MFFIQVTKVLFNIKNKQREFDQISQFYFATWFRYQQLNIAYFLNRHNLPVVSQYIVHSCHNTELTRLSKHTLSFTLDTILNEANVTEYMHIYHTICNCLKPFNMLTKRHIMYRVQKYSNYR